MFREKTVFITVLIAAVVFASFVNTTYAFKIVEMKPSHGGYKDYSDWLYHTASVETDEPYYFVSWYVNNICAHSSIGDNVKTKATFSPTGFPGSVYGTTYTIKAIAWSNGNVHHSDTDSYDVTVYRVADYAVNVHNGFGSNTGAWVHAEVTSIGWSGSTAYCRQYGEIANITGKKLNYVFKYQLWVTRVTQPGEKAVRIQEIYTRPLVVKQGTVDVGKINPLVVRDDLPDSYDGLENWAWHEDDVFRVEALTSVTVTFNQQWRNQDLFEAGWYEDLEFEDLEMDE